MQQKMNGHEECESISAETQRAVVRKCFTDVFKLKRIILQYEIVVILRKTLG